MTDALRIFLSGRVGIALGATDLELSGRHPRLLLALLATERHRTVPRDELAEALWGEDPPLSWQASLRVSLSKVRALLVQTGMSATVLTSGAGGYRLRLRSPVEVDVEEARRNLDAAERALATGDMIAAGDHAAAARVILAAPLVPGASGPWIDEMRRAATSLRVRALETEAEALLSRGEGAAAAAAAEQAIGLEPYQESAHRALMRAYAGAGNKAEALRCYERCRRLLAEELGIDPAPATKAIHMQVLRDELVASSASRRSQAVVEEAPGSALAAGREALARRRWAEAFEHLSRADREDDVSPEDLERLGEAALWSGHHAESVSARQRAHALYLEAGETRSAARAALALASNHGIRSQLAVAEGWFQTAARLLEGEAECPEHGFLAYVAAVVLHETGMQVESLDQAKRAFDFGRRFGIADLEAAGIGFQGFALARLERVAEALPLVDEGMALATSGRLSPLAAGQIYCRTIRTCLSLHDFRRAAEWIETVQQRAIDTGFGGYSGDCHAHLAAVLAARGSWDEAEREAERACDECEAFELSHVGLASYVLGEIHLHRGDLRLAEEAFSRANEYGVVPQPGLASLQLTRGDTAGALASATTFLEGTLDRLTRAGVLPVVVDAALASDARDRAQSAVDELTGIAEACGSTALLAAAARARGAISIADAEPAVALLEFRQAVDFYRRAEMPYELARTRALLASALLAAGDRAGAGMELAAAEDLCIRLGARPDARTCNARKEDLQRGAGKRPGGDAR